MTEMNLNLIPSGTPTKIYCDQGDKGIRAFAFVLMKDNAIYHPEAGATATAEGTKPNGGTFSHVAQLTDYLVEVELMEDMTDIAGETHMQIVLTEGNNRTGSQVII